MNLHIHFYKTINLYEGIKNLHNCIDNCIVHSYKAFDMRIVLSIAKDCTSNAFNLPLTTEAVAILSHATVSHIVMAHNKALKKWSSAGKTNLLLILCVCQWNEFKFNWTLMFLFVHILLNCGGDSVFDNLTTALHWWRQNKPWDKWQVSPLNTRICNEIAFLPFEFARLMDICMQFLDLLEWRQGRLHRFYCTITFQ